MAHLQTILWFVIALGILVTIHEYGHYWVARRCGIKVLRFSIGFGKPLWRWYNKEGTEFCLAAIPLGGYVKMLDEREGEVPAELLDQAFTRKPVLARIAVVAAGPLANFVLAVLLFWWMVMPGVTQVIPVVDKVEPGSIAARAGLEPGQEILAIDGQPTPSAQALHQRLLERLGESGSISFTVTYPNSELQYTSEAELDNWLAGEEEPNPLQGLGITLYSPKVSTNIKAAVAGGPAARAGLQAGDQILSINGQPVEDWQAMAQLIATHPDQDIELLVKRGVEQLSFTLHTDAVEQDGERVGRIGVESQGAQWPEQYLRQIDYNLVQGLWRGVEKTGETAWFVLLSVKKLLVGEISTKNLSGPITIAKVAGASAQAGLVYYVGFLALLSVSLGVFNLLPIPVLDGGHLFYYTIELVKGSPVSERIQMLGYQMGLLVVLGIMALAIYNDIMRL